MAPVQSKLHRVSTHLNVKLNVKYYILNIFIFLLEFRFFLIWESSI